MSYFVRFAGINHRSNADKEWTAVEELTSKIRKKRPQFFRDLAYSRHKTRYMTINGRTYKVVGLNFPANRLAYREDSRKN